MIKLFKKIILYLGLPFTFLAGLWFKIVIKLGFEEITDKLLMSLGVLPVGDHYYQPMINPAKHLSKSLRDDRNLPGIDFNVEEQLNLLAAFNYNEEILDLPAEKGADMEFFYNNGSYCSGDTDYLYNMIRHFKPHRIIEIGSGHSTLLAQKALSKNKSENPSYMCNHICIEPYEMPWLEKTGVEVVRKKVEDVPLTFFKDLGENDILFIDSSHVIRPQGDVLFEFLELLPTLNSGVIIHVHDIFTPKDYLTEWISTHFLWNEQYLLEAFLNYNSKFKIIGALNYLSHHYNKEFSDKCPLFAKQAGREPGAFWIKKI